MAAATFLARKFQHLTRIRRLLRSPPGRQRRPPDLRVTSCPARSGLGPDAEVITVPNSFVLRLDIALAGARPLCRYPSRLNIDPPELKPRSRRARRPLCRPSDGETGSYGEILKSRSSSFIVLEDAAQAVGAKLNVQRVGSLAMRHAFSLQSTQKPLRDLRWRHRHCPRSSRFSTSCLSTRNTGLKSRDECEFWSFNCRSIEVQALCCDSNCVHLEQRRGPPPTRVSLYECSARSSPYRKKARVSIVSIRRCEFRLTDLDELRARLVERGLTCIPVTGPTISGRE